MDQEVRQWRWAFPLAMAIVLADAVTKELVQTRFAYGERLQVTDYFNLVFVLNPGAAFSFLAGASGWQKPILLGIGISISVAIAFWLARKSMDRLPAFGLAAVLGGGAGNVIDRARHGAVVDWLDFHLAGSHWPAFNLSDTAITIGAAVLLLDAFVAPRTGAPEGAAR